ncbi:Stc1 domain-containing protein [Hypoxylon trugodes]|uniref:Stc1 domain-containing protein n=1 Tax=Hypoxylon trugodes TaxID=326681 RepID=UPI00218F472A|nr:Stc1 domain-containing protein [Hypoxylon trugodes]KAI1388730.1 Stc1 domain-containing protein [Hypoxylon trugodes]
MAPFGQRPPNAIPHAFKCAVDGQWHPPTKFSRKQLEIWQKQKKSPNDGVTPESVRLVCKDHNSGGPKARERKCNGPCDLWKGIDAFSKAQRNDRDAWCKECTTWKTTFAGNEIPDAPPGETIASQDIEVQTTSLQNLPPSLADDLDLDEVQVPDSHLASSTMEMQSLEMQSMEMRSDELESAEMQSTEMEFEALSLSENHPWADVDADDNDDEDIGLVLNHAIGMTRDVSRYDVAYPTTSIDDRVPTEAISTTSLAYNNLVASYRPNRGGPISSRLDRAVNIATPRTPKGPSQKSLQYAIAREEKDAKGDARFPKMDNRRVFNIAPEYAARPPGNSNPAPTTRRLNSPDSDVSDSDSD